MFNTDNFNEAYLQQLGYDEEPSISVNGNVGEDAPTISKKICIETDNMDLIDLVSQEQDVLSITVTVSGNNEDDIQTIEIPVEAFKVISIEDLDNEADAETIEDTEAEIIEEDEDEIIEEDEDDEFEID